MPIVVVRMQVLARGRDRFVPQLVTHVSQVNLSVHHPRPGRVPQPMGGGLAQPFCGALVRFARGLQVGVIVLFVQNLAVCFEMTIKINDLL